MLVTDWLRSRRQPLLVLLAGSALLLLSALNVSHDDAYWTRRPTDDVVDSKTRQALTALRTCCQRRPTNDTDGLYWNAVSQQVTECVRLLTNIQPGTYQRFHMGRFDEEKVFLPLVEQGERCTWLTIGIGGDTKVEKEFALAYPSCELFGIEPMEYQAADFESLGTVIRQGAGVEAKTEVLVVRTNNPANRYIQQKLSVQPLQVLLDTHVHSRFVNFATLDIEGFEFELLKPFFHGQQFDRAGVVLCQLDVEWHAHEKQRPGTDGDLFIQRFIADSPYVPIFATNFGRHRKMTFVHATDARCLRSIQARPLLQPNYDHDDDRMTDDYVV